MLRKKSKLHSDNKLILKSIMFHEAVRYSESPCDDLERKLIEDTTRFWETDNRCYSLDFPRLLL